MTRAVGPGKFRVLFRFLFEASLPLMNDPDRARSHERWPAVAAAVAALLVATAACGDDPFEFDWSDRPDTVLLYSLARPELNLVSGFNFLQRTPITIEATTATGTWDAAVDTRGGAIVLMPPGAFGIVTTARITTLEDMRLEDVTSAPGDTTVYVADEPVPVEAGNVYVVKTNRTAGSFGSSCVYYAKLEPVVIDPIGGTLTFRHVTNPVCNSLDLVPPN